MCILRIKKIKVSVFSLSLLLKITHLTPSFPFSNLSYRCKCFSRGENTFEKFHSSKTSKRRQIRVNRLFFVLTRIGDNSFLEMKNQLIYYDDFNPNQSLLIHVWNRAIIKSNLISDKVFFIAIVM